MWKRLYIGNPSKCSCENRKYLASIMDHLVIMCDDYVLKAISIYCYFRKCRVKQKHLLPFHIRNNKLKDIMC